MKHATIDDLIEEHKGLIFYTLSLYNCIKSPDVVSVAYEALWRAIETYDEAKGEFSTYAVTCIKNAAYDEMRKIKARNEREVLTEDIGITYTHRSSRGSLSAETRKAVDDALKDFSGKKLKIALLWLNNHELSATAIADEVECSQSYASQVILEFKNAVRKRLTNVRNSPNTAQH